MLQKYLVGEHEADKLHLRQLDDIDEVEVFQNYTRNKTVNLAILLVHIERYNPNKDDNSFMIKIYVIDEVRKRLAQEMNLLVEAKKIELQKGLSLERIQQFLQFEADESHVGDQCKVCLEEVEVGRLMKQLDCGGRHSFCSVCIDQWFANHKTCSICRHIF